jgi:hypothetical protein
MPTFRDDPVQSFTHVTEAIVGRTFAKDLNGIFGSNDGSGNAAATGLPNGSGVWGHTNVNNGSGVVGSVAPGLTRTAAGVTGIGPLAGRFFGDVEATGHVMGVQGNFQAHGFLGATDGTTEHKPVGVFGINWSGNGLAGLFAGNVSVSGTIFKAGGGFKIDHPLDPENKCLCHSFVESPDMKNVYDGVSALDSKGEASITLPDWFEALNRDFRYQLTSIGSAAPNLHVAEEIISNRFRIAGGKPGTKVSWQVTGIRRDAYAEHNRIAVAPEKTLDERGKYLHPKEHGLPESRRMDYDLQQRLEKREMYGYPSSGVVTKIDE